MDTAWYAIEWSQVVGILATTVGLYVVFGVLLRLNGLRSLTKMSSFDFVTTIAIGSLLATVVLTDSPSLLAGTVALVGLFAVQGGASVVRRRFDTSSVENQPVLLMDGPTILEANLARTRVTHADLRAKLREANVLNLDQVVAVVLETTGEVSVLSGDATEFDRDLLADVIGT